MPGAHFTEIKTKIHLPADIQDVEYLEPISLKSKPRYICRQIFKILLGNIFHLDLRPGHGISCRFTFENDLLHHVCYLFYLLKNERQKRIQLKNDRDVLRNNLTQLTLTNLEYQKFAAHIEEEAADSERKRITRDIHDTVGYTMANVSMAMEAALRLIPPDDNELRKLILLTKEQARDGLKETRDALYRLRQHEVETIRGLQAVRKLASIFEQITGIHVKQDYSNVNGSFGDDVDRFLFRFVQEGLVNAFKHAKPTEIDIYFYLTDNILHVHIADNGRGCTALKEGIGMQGIRERLSRLGGELNLHCDSSGFALLANIPIESNNGEENHGSNGNTNRR